MILFRRTSGVLPTSSVRSREYFIGFMPFMAWGSTSAWESASGFIVEVQSAFGLGIADPAAGALIIGIHGFARTGRRAATDAGVAFLGERMLGNFPQLQIHFHVRSGPVG